MTSRYDKETLRVNRSETYRKQLSDRNVPFIRQYGTPSFNEVSDNEMDNLTIVSHVWSLGDRFFKLAHTYYQDPSMWWVLAWFNGTPTESQLEIGDVVDIPLPLDYILEVWESSK
tara:strand:- start:2 stop:346 length:345 start_codon:yes stop_codon:yes gene_type:complete